MTEAPLRRYFRLPEDVKPGDFVHQIERSSSEAAIRRTLELYEVTPSIARNLDRALDNVQSGLADRRSVFTWIHGSFGSGKSHFMNVLSLLLADEKAVYAVHPDLQEQRAKHHPGAIGRKLFRLHVQCISRQAETLEDIVLGAATEELARLHPDAPAPALFESGKLFTAAERLLDDLGDEKFFKELPSNSAQDSDWGELSQKWDRARFKAAVAAPQSAEAQSLAGELARTPWFGGIVASAKLVPLGQGLQALAAHLSRLGYEGAVLFLDELVLWLATKNTAELAREAPKVSTLVEHGDYPPALPFLTFAARQRDLSQMVGNLAVGRDEVVFRDHLSFWRDRFDNIQLEDKDLPRIIEKRLLKPTSDAAKSEIDAAFETYKRTLAQDFRRLTGNQGDAEDFRRMYPLSPALVDVMVALSATLQRDRTALRELTRLLVEYLPDFELGKVVPVGDLFDVVAHGQTSDLPALQQLYEKARQIYESDLLPHIRKKEKTDSKARCQLLREEFDRRLGCSGCAESACRTQTRVAKTVLLQGLVPRASALQQLTASSLVYLNSGTLKSKVPNKEPATVAKWLRDWAGVTPAIHVQGDADPVVRADLDVVDVRRILDSAVELDNEQRRRIRVREALFRALGVTQRDQGGSRTFDWRGRRWRVGFVYDNTRLANDHVFRPNEDEDLRVVLDFPFDEVGKGPRDDEERVAQIVDGLTGADAERGLPTIVWLPSFLDEDTKEILKHLVILDGLVGSSDRDLANRLSWVSLDDLPRVRATLEQQRQHRSEKIERALASAYGVSHDADGSLSPGMSPERHVHLLRRDAKIAVPADGLFERALEAVLKQALETRAPRHPVLGKPPTRGRLESVLALLDRLVEAPDRRARFDRAELDDLRAIAAAEHLGIVRILEDEATMTGGILDQVQKNLAHHKGPLSVGAVRRALDPDGLMELSPELSDFLVLAYAKVATRPLRLFSHGQQVTGLLGKLTDDMALLPVDLPGQEVWQRALLVGQCLGITTGKALTPARMDELAGLARAKAKALGEKGLLGEAAARLGEWQQLAGVTEPVERTQRGSVLATLSALVAAIAKESESAAVVSALGKFPLEASRVTALTHMAEPGKVAALLDTLRSQAWRTQVELGRRLEADPAHAGDAAGVMKGVRDALAGDENVWSLKAAIEKAAAEITRMMMEAGPPISGGGARPPPRPEPPRGGAQEPSVGTINLPWPGPGSEMDVAEAPEGGRISVNARGPTGPQKPERFHLSRASDVDALTERLRERLAAGERLRVTIEIDRADGGEE
jgi:hypothetical protein